MKTLLKITSGIILPVIFLALQLSCKTTGGGSSSSSPESLGKNIIAAMQSKQAHSSADKIFFTEKDFKNLRKEVLKHPDIDEVILKKYRDDIEFSVTAFNELKPEIISCRRQWGFITGTYTSGIKSISGVTTRETSRRVGKNGVTVATINIRFTKIAEKEKTGGELNLSAYLLNGGYQIKKIDVVR